MITTTQNNKNLNQVQDQASPRDNLIKNAKLAALVTVVTLSIIALMAVTYATAPVLLPFAATFAMIVPCLIMFWHANPDIEKDETQNLEPSSQNLGWGEYP